MVHFCNCLARQSLATSGTQLLMLGVAHGVFHYLADAAEVNHIFVAEIRRLSTVECKKCARKALKGFEEECPHVFEHVMKEGVWKAAERRFSEFGRWNVAKSGALGVVLWDSFGLSILLCQGLIHHPRLRHLLASTNPDKNWVCTNKGLQHTGCQDFTGSWFQNHQQIRNHRAGSHELLAAVGRRGGGAVSGALFSVSGGGHANRRCNHKRKETKFDRPTGVGSCNLISSKSVGSCGHALNHWIKNSRNALV